MRWFKRNPDIDKLRAENRKLREDIRRYDDVRNRLRISRNSVAELNAKLSKLHMLEDILDDAKHELANPSKRTGALTREQRLKISDKVFDMVK